jgi:hypothetical protein
MLESKSSARSYSTAVAESSASTSSTADNSTPNTKESLAWFRFRQAQWKGSPRRKIRTFPTLLPLNTPTKSVTKERPGTATVTTTSVSIRQQPVSQPPSTQCATAIHPAPSTPTPTPHPPASFSATKASFAPMTTSPRQSLIASPTTAYKQQQQQQEINDDTMTVAAATSASTMQLLLVILLRNVTAAAAAAARSTTAAAHTPTYSTPVSTENTPNASVASGEGGAYKSRLSFGEI